jgi:hypothetical protein
MLVWLWLAATASAATTQWPQYLAGTATGDNADHLVWSSANPGCNTDLHYTYTAQVVLKLVGSGGSFVNYRLAGVRNVTFSGTSDNVCPPASGQASSTRYTTIGWDSANSSPWSGFVNIAGPPTGNLEVGLATLYTDCTGPGCGSGLVGSPAPSAVFDSTAATPLVTVTRSGPAGGIVTVDAAGSKTTHNYASNGDWTATHVRTVDAHLQGVTPAQALKDILKPFAKLEAKRALLESVLDCGGLALSAHGLAGELAAASAEGPGPESAAAVAMISGAYGRYSTIKSLTTNPIEGLQDQARSCGAALVWFVQAYKLLKDPPIGNPEAVVLPVTPALRPINICGHYSHRLRPTCVRLTRLLQAVSLDTAKLMATYGASLAAIDSLSSADAAGDQLGIALQTATLEALHAELVPRQRALRVDQVSLAKLLKHFLKHAALSARASHKIESYVVRQAEKLGASARDVQALQFAPRRLDLIKTLAGSPLAAAGATAIAHGLTIDDLRSLADALTSAPQAQKLNADLDQTPAATAIARFVADTKSLPAQAAQLLSAAAGAAS